METLSLSKSALHLFCNKIPNKLCRLSLSLSDFLIVVDLGYFPQTVRTRDAST